MADQEFAPELTVEPRSVDDAREAIEQTRERISATLDEIETRIDATKQELRRRADVLRPVRERIAASPWTALAIGAGAGLALGLLTGRSGGDSDEARASRAGKRPERYEDDDRGRRGRRGSEHESETAYGTSRLHVHGGEHGGRTRADARGRGSMQERIVDHLLDAVAGAVSEGISARFRRKLLD